MSGCTVRRYYLAMHTDTVFHSIIISTRDVAEGFPLEDFFTLLNVNGSFVTCGMPDKPYPPMTAQGMAANAAQFCGSHIGSKRECQQMLQMCADKGECLRSPRETRSGRREADVCFPAENHQASRHGSRSCPCPRPARLSRTSRTTRSDTATSSRWTSKRGLERLGQCQTADESKK